MITELAIAIGLAACQPREVSQTSLLSEERNSTECTEWVDSVLSTLSDRDKVAQLMCSTINPADGNASKAVIRQYVADQKVGAILFSEGTLNDYATMTNYAQSISDVPLLMTLDGEWGLSMRIPQAPRFPYNMGLGAIQDPALLYEYGKEVARECNAMGIHVNFAPVLDVNSNPSNPVIGYRSLGEDPARVAELGTAYSMGLEQGGVIAVGKHFPGHGDTNADSHKTLPVIPHSLDTLQKVDLKPFADFINAGASGIMVGHLSVPALDSTLTPASMSKAIITDLLKDKMHFSGLVFTDALAMKGADGNGNPCVNAFMAGADMLLNPGNPAPHIDAMLKAISNGQISMEEVEERVRKVLTYKYMLGLPNLTPIDVENAEAIVNGPQADLVNTQLADASFTVVRNNANLLPLGNLDTTSIAVVNIGAHANNEFEEMCRSYAKIDAYQGSALDSEALAAIKKHDVVIAAVFTDDEASRSQLAMLKDIPSLIPVFMVNPYKMAKFRQSISTATTLAIAYDNTPYTRRSAAKGLFGGIKVNGKLPVNLRGIAKIGDGVNLQKTRLGYSSPLAMGLNPNLEQRIDSAINQAMADGAFPGCQVLVAKQGEIVIDKCYGKTTKSGHPVNSSTLYDLASVSKTVGTLPGIMKAYDLGLIDLDTVACAYIPQLDVPGKSDLTPRMLLYHETGMPPSLSLFKVMMDTNSYEGKLLTSKRDKNHTLFIYKGLWGNQHAKIRKDIASWSQSEDKDIECARGLFLNSAAYDTIMRRIYDIKVKDTRKYLYSCLNFCLLMDIEQRVTSQPHQNWITDSIWAPIGAYNFCYRPAETHRISNIAATEKDTYLRKQHLQGYVHDELAAFSGGIQGNAGVFGTSLDVAKLCQMWLNGGWYGDKRILSDETTRYFITDKSPNSRRGLGFDKPDMLNPNNSPTCEEATAEVFGHTGYTGTVFWVDPNTNLIFVFLCNRIDPSRNNPAFTKSAIRPTLMSLIYQAML